MTFESTGGPGAAGRRQSKKGRVVTIIDCIAAIISNSIRVSLVVALFVAALALNVGMGASLLTATLVLIPAPMSRCRALMLYYLHFSLRSIFQLAAFGGRRWGCAEVCGGPRGGRMRLQNIAYRCAHRFARARAPRVGPPVGSRWPA